MPSMLKYKGELYAKVIDSDSEGVEIVENPTIENPAQEHGVSESVSEILQKIENLQHELTAEIEKLKAIEAQEVLCDSLDLSKDRELKIMGNEIDSYIMRKYKNSYPSVEVTLRGDNFQIFISHKADFDEKEIQDIISFSTREIKREFSNAKTHAKYSSKTITIFGEL